MKNCLIKALSVLIQSSLQWPVIAIVTSLYQDKTAYQIFYLERNSLRSKNSTKEQTLSSTVEIL